MGNKRKSIDEEITKLLKHWRYYFCKEDNSFYLVPRSLMGVMSDFVAQTHGFPITPEAIVKTLNKTMDNRCKEKGL